MFYLDFLAAHDDTNAINALRHLEEIAPFVRILGSYPLDMSFVNLSSPIDSNSSISQNSQGVLTEHLKIGIAGFGVFGQFISKKFISQGHRVIAMNFRKDYSAEARALNVQYCDTADEFLDQVSFFFFFLVNCHKIA